MAPLLIPPTVYSHDGALQLNKFYYISDADLFVYAPTRALWTATTINGRFPSIKTTKKVNGKYVYQKPADWLRACRAVEQQTWVPGEPEIIEDRLVTNGGWRVEPGTHAFNLYQPPNIVLGDAGRATLWIEHLKLLFPEDAEDIANWCAQRVQHPNIKINHVLVLGGPQGIGKDWLLQALKMAIGPWNFQEISPTDLLCQYTPYVKAVVLRMNEAHDLGESGRADRYALYEREKIYAAAPPDVLPCVDKWIRRFYVPNVLGLIITTNHKTDGVYLPNDDRRHLVAWSERTKEEFPKEYWNERWHWLLHEGGAEHVAAYLTQRDLSAFDPCAVPRQTTAFFEIVNANCAPEDAELADALDELGNGQGRPAICSLLAIAGTKSGATMEWLLDRKRRRSIPYRLERNGYIAFRNPEAKDGLWYINGKRQTLYADVEANLTPKERLQAANDYVAQQTNTIGNS